MDTYVWNKYDCASSKILPPCSEGHGLTYLDDRNQFLLYGGMSSARYEDIYLLNPSKKTWQILDTTGRKPPSRCYFACWYDPPYYFIHGGRGEKGKLFSDVFFINIDNKIWKRAYLFDFPVVREQHQMCHIPKKREAILFGGYCCEKNILFDDVYIFNYSNLVLEKQIEAPGSVWTKKETKGERPSARKGHQMILKDSTLYLFGGNTSIQPDPSKVDNTLYILNVETLVWSKLKTIGPEPEPRFLHCMEFFDERRIIIFGGCSIPKDLITLPEVYNSIYFLDTEELIFSRPFSANFIPSARYGSAIASTRDSVYPMVIVIGGINKEYTEFDPYVLTEQKISVGTKWELSPCKIEKAKKVGLEKEIERTNKLIVDQKIRIVKLEQEHSDVMLQKNKLESEYLTIKKDLETDEVNLQTLLQELNETNNQLNEEKSSYEIKLTNLNSLVNAEKKLQDFYKSKIENLESLFKKTEQLIIKLDNCNSAILQTKFKSKYNSQINGLTERIKEHYSLLTTLKIEYVKYEKIEKSILKEERTKKDENIII